MPFFVEIFNVFKFRFIRELEQKTQKPKNLVNRPDFYYFSPGGPAGTTYACTCLYRPVFGSFVIGTKLEFQNWQLFIAKLIPTNLY